MKVEGEDGDDDCGEDYGRATKNTGGTTEMAEMFQWMQSLGE